eukprot:6457816-Amphidinium_carterae.1
MAWWHADLVGSRPKTKNLVTLEKVPEWIAGKKKEKEEKEKAEQKKAEEETESKNNEGQAVLQVEVGGSSTDEEGAAPALLLPSKAALTSLAGTSKTGRGGR